MLRKFLIFLALSLVCGCNNQSVELKPRGNHPHKKFFSDTLAECSKLKSEDLQIQGLLSTIYDNQKFLPTAVQLNLNQFPKNFFTTKDMYGEFKAWRVAKGKRITREIPISFLFLNKSTGIPIERAFVDRLSLNSFDIASFVGKLDRAQYTDENFLNHFSLLLVHLEPDWEGVSLTFYSSDRDLKVLSTMETLLPPFVANPLKYSKIVQSGELEILHPLWNTKDDGSKEDVFIRRAQAICNAFDNEVNVPRPVLNFFTSVVQKVKSIFEK